MGLRTVLPFIVICLIVPIWSENQERKFVPRSEVGNNELPVTQEVQDLVQSLYPKIKARVSRLPGGKNIIGDITPISYRPMIVYGINYFIKVSAPTAQKTVYYQLKIYKPLRGKPRLYKVVPTGPNSPITFF